MTNGGYVVPCRARKRSTRRECDFLCIRWDRKSRQCGHGRPHAVRVWHDLAARGCVHLKATPGGTGGQSFEPGSAAFRLVALKHALHQTRPCAAPGLGDPLLYRHAIRPGGAKGLLATWPAHGAQSAIMITIPICVCSRLASQSATTASTGCEDLPSLLATAVWCLSATTANC